MLNNSIINNQKPTEQIYREPTTSYNLIDTMSDSNRENDDGPTNGLNIGNDILEALLSISAQVTQHEQNSENNSDENLDSLSSIGGEYSTLNSTIDELNKFMDRWEERHDRLREQIHDVLAEDPLDELDGDEEGLEGEVEDEEGESNTETTAAEEEEEGESNTETTAAEEEEGESNKETTAAAAEEGEKTKVDGDDASSSSSSPTNDKEQPPTPTPTEGGNITSTSSTSPLDSSKSSPEGESGSCEENKSS